MPIVLNKQLQLKFILDTGVPTSILTEKSYSDILKILYTKKYILNGPGNTRPVEAYLANDVTIDMPGVYGKGHALLVLGEDYLELKNTMGIPVHGILGYELFSRFVVKIDYRNKKMVLQQPAHFKPGKRYEGLPMTIENTKPFIQTTVQLNDSTKLLAKVMVDTGASHGLFLETSSDEKIIVPDRNILCIIGRGIGGDIRGKVARINFMLFGKFTLENILVSFPEGNDFKDTLRSNYVFRNGSLGGDILSMFTVVFNYGDEKIFFKKSKSLKKKFEYNLTGLRVMATGLTLHEFEVIQVDENSPAQRAGIMPGDRIVSINNVSLNNYDLAMVNSFFNARLGKKMKLLIIRNNEEIKKEFRLESQI